MSPSPTRVEFGISLPNRADLFDNLHEHILQQVVRVGGALNPRPDERQQLSAQRLPQLANRRFSIVHRQQHFPVEAEAGC